MIASAMIPRGTPTPAPMTVPLLLPSALDEGLEVTVLARICVTESGMLLNVLLLDVDEGGDTFAVMDGVLDVIKDVVGDDAISDVDVAGDDASAMCSPVKELMTGTSMTLLPVPQLHVSSSGQQN